MPAFFGLRLENIFLFLRLAEKHCYLQGISLHKCANSLKKSKNISFHS